MKQILVIWDVWEGMLEEAFQMVCELSRNNRVRLCTLEQLVFHDNYESPTEVQPTPVKELVQWADILFVPLFTGELLQDVENGMGSNPLAQIILLGLYNRSPIYFHPFHPFLTRRSEELGLRKWAGEGTDLRAGAETPFGEEKGKIITNKDVRCYRKKIMELNKNDKITPLAKEEALKLGIVIRYAQRSEI